MSKKEDRLRQEGMDFCMRYLEANNGDIEALKAELKRRGAYHIPLWLNKSAEMEFCHRTRETCFDTIMIMSVAVLHDTFGFGQKRVDRFMDAFNYAANLLDDDCINWDEIQAGIREQLGRNLKIRWSVLQKKEADTA